MVIRSVRLRYGVGRLAETSPAEVAINPSAPGLCNFLFVIRLRKRARIASIIPVLNALCFQSTMKDAVATRTGPCTVTRRINPDRTEISLNIRAAAASFPSNRVRCRIDGRGWGGGSDKKQIARRIYSEIVHRRCTTATYETIGNEPRTFGLSGRTRLTRAVTSRAIAARYRITRICKNNSVSFFSRVIYFYQTLCFFFRTLCPKATAVPPCHVGLLHY